MQTWEPTFRVLNQELVDLVLAQQWATPSEIQLFLNDQLPEPAHSRVHQLLVLVTMEINPMVPVQ